MTTPMENAADYSASEALAFCTPDEFAGRRLDQALAALMPQHSRNRIQGWIKSGLVRVDAVVETEAKRKVKAGQQIVVTPEPDPSQLAAQPEDIPLDIVFEDDEIMVINKPVGLVVHPGSGNWQGTLLNAVLFHAPPLASLPRGGIVHRLDKDTSGLMVVAKTLRAQTDLVRQLQTRSVKRHYLALVQGELQRGGTVNAPMARHPTLRTKMAVVHHGGKVAITHYEVRERFPRCTLVLCSLETGRTHQIRVHMAHLGYPLIGDQVYGKVDVHVPQLPRQALHAFRLGLIHPATGEAMQWQAPVPDDMRDLLRTLRQERDSLLAEEEFDDDDYDVEVFYVRGDGEEDAVYIDEDGAYLDEAEYDDDEDFADEPDEPDTR